MTLTCNKCGHTWTPRTEKPKCCPACKRYGWDNLEDAEKYAHVCGDCGQVWVSRAKNPRQCPECNIKIEPKKEEGE